jgi:hypothetical protein
MNFKGKISKIRFDNQAYNQALRDRMKIQVRRAVSDWLKAVIEFVPVSTGMARASLKPLGDILDVDVFDAQTIGNDPIRKASPTRNLELGEAVGEYQAHFQGNQYSYIFSFEILIPHWQYNEFGFLSEEHKAANVHIRYGYVAPQVFPPWQSLEHGKEAFQSYMRDRLKEALPKLKDYMVFTKVRIDG